MLARDDDDDENGDQPNTNYHPLKDFLKIGNGVITDQGDVES